MSMHRAVMFFNMFEGKTPCVLKPDGSQWLGFRNNRSTVFRAYAPCSLGLRVRLPFVCRRGILKSHNRSAVDVVPTVRSMFETILEFSIDKT